MLSQSWFHVSVVHPRRHSRDELNQNLVDWIRGAPARRALNRQRFQDGKDTYSESEFRLEDSFRRMIERLLESPSEDPASDEVFAALMENGAYCYDDERDVIELGEEEDFPYTDLTSDGMPYLKKFLSEIPKNMKTLRVRIHSPEILRTFPDQIGNEGSTLEEIVITCEWNNDLYYEETGRLESLSLANLLYVTRNVKDVCLEGFHAFTPNNANTNSSLKAFHSQTKIIRLDDTMICDESPIVLHPDSTVSFESIEFFRLHCAPELNFELEVARLFWRQWLQASRETLSAIKISYKRSLIAGMCIEAASQDLQNIKTIDLCGNFHFGDAEPDLDQPLNLLASSRVGSTLKRLELNFRGNAFLSTMAGTVSTFENLEELVVVDGEYYALDRDDDEEDYLNLFLPTYLRFEPPALRNIGVEGIKLSGESLQALFSSKTLESITLRVCDCLPLFPAGRTPFSSKLRSLNIRRFNQPDFSDSNHILSLLTVLPELRILNIDAVRIVDEKDAKCIVDGISTHKYLCRFECDTEFNEALRLPCLRNRFNASSKQLPMGFIPNVVLRSEELCGESGIFLFLKEQYPSYLGST